MNFAFAGVSRHSSGLYGPWESRDQGGVDEYGVLDGLEGTFDSLVRDFRKLIQQRLNATDS
jgi:hypothetical protein